MNWPMLPSLVLALDPGTPYRASSGVVHQRPPSCRQGQRLARTAPRVRKGAQPDFRPVSPPQQRRPCLASSAARPASWRLSFSWCGGGGACSFLAWIPPPLGGRANASQRPLSPVGRPGNKGRFEARRPGAANPGPGPMDVAPIWPAARSLSLGSRTVPQGLCGYPTCLADVAEKHDDRVC